MVLEGDGRVLREMGWLSDYDWWWTWLVGRLVGRLVGWLVGWLVDWVILLIDWLIQVDLIWWCSCCLIALTGRLPDWLAFALSSMYTSKYIRTCTARRNEKIVTSTCYQYRTEQGVFPRVNEKEQQRMVGWQTRRTDDCWLVDSGLPSDGLGLLHSSCGSLAENDERQWEKHPGKCKEHVGFLWHSSYY